MIFTVRWAHPIAFFFVLTLSLCLFIPPAFAEKKPGYPLLDDAPLPKSISLCGEPMPLKDPYVLEMLDRELTISVWDRAQVFMWLKRSGRYFPYIEKRLAEAGVPDDLKYLAVAESSLITHIRSSKGALGTWQFMAETGRNHGLRKDRTIDERHDFERATEAAITYLKSLKDEFGTWTLAMAAYNCGEARLRKEMKEQKERDYYSLNLPMETERYIFRIATVKLIMENPNRYGYHLSPERVYRPIECDRESVSIRRPVHIADLAHALGTNYKTLKELNPQIQGPYLPKGNYSLKVPAGLGSKVNTVLKKVAPAGSVPRAETSAGTYVVQPGDTLS
ncbi:MAG: transglycosylase SLT domain-containing protein, partial [Pseudomonadota bacterium]